MQELNFESVDFFNTALAIKKVKKSSGILQEFIPEKLIKVLEWACAGTLVEPYDLFKKIKPHLVDEMTTEEIQSAAIKVAADNITKTSADYQYVASNLAMFGLRKQVYDQFEPIKLVELIEQNIEAGVYDPEVLQKYSAKELQEFDDFIKHDKDFTMTYAGTMQLIEKYLVKNRVSGKVYETPQFAYMLMGMVLHQNEKPGKARTENVKNYYEAASDRKISLPTPLMAGVRTPTRQFSSCVVIEAGDSLDSINGSSASIIKYISKRAGIGIHGGAIRAEGSTIGHGEVKHTGVIPFWKHFQSAVKSCVTPDTLVMIKGQGTMKIDEVVPGMEILTTENPGPGGSNHYRKVLDKWDSIVKKENQLILAFENGTIIRCSSDHKIMYFDDETKTIKRILPLELTEDHKIIDVIGWTKLKSREQDDQDERYIDITVEGTESFFARDLSNGPEDRMVLISNCSQGGLRGGAATMHYPVWHLEFENLIVLKNNKGVDENRIRHLDYSVQLNDLMFDRLLSDGYITLFSPDVADGKLFEYFYNDQEAFKELYEKLEKDASVRKKRIKATEVFFNILNERANTGRIYLMFIDNVSKSTPFDTKVDPIKMSNLCITGDQLVATDKGLLTAKELYTMGTKLITHDGSKKNKTSEMKLRRENVPVYKITLANGMTHTVTEDHEVMTDNGLVAAIDLVANKSKIAINKSEGIFGETHMPEEAFILGLFEGDGTTTNEGLRFIDLFENKTLDMETEIQSIINILHEKYTGGLRDVKNGSSHKVVGTRVYKPSQFFECKTNGNFIKKRCSISFGRAEYLNFTKGEIPKWIMTGTRETQMAYIRGLFLADGTINMAIDVKTPAHLSVTSTNKTLMETLLVMLNNMGYNFGLYIASEAGMKKMPDGNGGYGLYFCKEAWRLVCGNRPDIIKFQKETGFLTARGIEYLEREYRDNTRKFVKCTSVELLPETEDVYCPTVESEEHLFVANGIITSNCQEILLPTSPISEIDEEIALCTLSAFVLGSFDHKDQDEINKLSMVMVRALDNLLDYQDYPVHQALAAKRRRALGIGVTNYAAWLAQNFRRYDDEKSTLREVHELFERLQFGLIKASNDLAKEKGMPDLVARTNYAKGLLPIDWYNKNVDKLTGAPKYACDWETLRADVLEHGVRNSTLSAFMPCETSSQVSNSTNGIEPPRAAITTKQSKDGVFNQIVPEIESLESVYDYAWDMSKRGNRGYLSHVAVMQKFVDQSISTNTYYDPQNYENNKVPVSQMLEDIIFANYHGIKTLYYHNTRDGADASEEFECDSCSV